MLKASLYRPQPIVVIVIRGFDLSEPMNDIQRSRYTPSATVLFSARSIVFDRRRFW